MEKKDINSESNILNIYERDVTTVFILYCFYIAIFSHVQVVLSCPLKSDVKKSYLVNSYDICDDKSVVM